MRKDLLYRSHQSIRATQTLRNCTLAREMKLIGLVETKMVAMCRMKNFLFSTVPAKICTNADNRCCYKEPILATNFVFSLILMAPATTLPLKD